MPMPYKSILTIVVLASAIAVTLVPVTGSAAPPDRSSATSVYRTSSPSIVVVDVLDNDGASVALGSGVVIQPGKVVTNCHVVAAGRNFRIRQMRSTFGARLLKADSDHDLCLLEVPELRAPVVKRGDSRSLQVGQVVYAIGAPDGLELTISEGIVSSIREEGAVRVIQTSAPLSPGSSGGGLFDEAGRLVGITTFSMRNGQNLNFAVPVEWIPLGDAAPLSSAPPGTESFPKVESRSPSAEQDPESAAEQPTPNNSAWKAPPPFADTPSSRQSVAAEEPPLVTARKWSLWAKSAEGGTPPNWSSTDMMYQAVAWMAYRTAPSTWANEGGYGLKWGMGPGDVKKLFPSLKIVIPGLAKESQFGGVDQSVRGLNSSVAFKFYRGQLYEVDIDPNGPSLSRTDADTYQQLLEQYWKNAWAWRRGMRQLLQQAYGEPACAPSKRTIARTCDEISYQGCGALNSQMRERLLRWVWRTPRTEIVLTGGSAPKLVYADLFLVSLVRHAETLARADYDRKKAAEAAAEEDRISGRPVEQPLGAPSSEAVAIEEATEPVIPPLQCFKDPDEPSADAANQSSSWSQNGWGSFRWGMGPSDVKAALPPDARSKAVWDPGTLDGGRIVLPQGLGIGMVGKRPLTAFHFWKEKLVSITVSMDSEDKSLDRWSKDVSAYFKKKCGRARCVKDGGYENCTWDRAAGLWVKLSKFTGGSDFEILNLALDDPAQHAPRISEALLQKGTARRTWSKQGWDGFRWGMGIADVFRRCTERHGDVNALRRPACYASPKTPGVIECTLERDFHKLRILDQAPNLSFRFNDGRLSSVQLQFPKDMSHDSFWDTADRVRAILASKYGAPSEDSSSKKEELKYLSLTWKMQGLRVWYHASLYSQESSMLLTYEDPTSVQSGSAADSSKL